MLLTIQSHTLTQSKLYLMYIQYGNKKMMDVCILKRQKEHVMEIRRKIKGSNQFIMLLRLQKYKYIAVPQIDSIVAGRNNTRNFVSCLQQI